jgi:Ca2+-binding RTX toxin-like protein
MVMANLTANEQLMLELINRARMDPAGEAKRYGISLNEGVPSDKTISTSAKQVLAGNDLIGTAAQQHSDWMLAEDKFSHFEGSPGSTYYSPFDRMEEAGYTGYSTAGENIAWTGSTSALNETQTILALHQALFVDAGYPERGHRTNMLRDVYKEIGVGHEVGGGYKPPGYSTSYNASIITTDFGARGSATFITGVVYDDTTTNDNFFTVGEQTAGRGVGGSGANDTTGAGGGYELAFASTGSKTITFDLADADLTVKVKLGSKNLKLDAVNGDEIWTNAASLTSQSTAIKALYALGVSKVNLSGSSTGEKITGNKAANTLDGSGGNDSITGGSGKDTLIGGTGRDTLSGGSSDDQFRFETAADSTIDAPDRVKDFGDSGADKIDLSRVFSGVLTYRDEKAINGANQVNVTAGGSDVIVHVNLDDDLDDEMQIVLSNTSLGSMSSGDFIL